jgi:hypothetical protein
MGVVAEQEETVVAALVMAAPIKEERLEQAGQLVERMPEQVGMAEQEEQAEVGALMAEQVRLELVAVGAIILDGVLVEQLEQREERRDTIFMR